MFEKIGLYSVLRFFSYLIIYHVRRVMKSHQEFPHTNDTVLTTHTHAISLGTTQLTTVSPGGAGRKEPCLRLLALTTSFQLPAAWCRLWYATNQPPVVARVTTVGRCCFHLTSHTSR